MVLSRVATLLEDLLTGLSCWRVLCFCNRPDGEAISAAVNRRKAFKDFWMFVQFLGICHIKADLRVALLMGEWAVVDGVPVGNLDKGLRR